MENLKYYCDELERSLLSIDKEESSKVLLEAVSHYSAFDVANKIITATLRRIGELWEAGALSLSQVYMSGLICEELIDSILPTREVEIKNQPKMAIAVFEDYHLLGKRIIYSSLRASGFELLDLGGGISADKIVELVNRENIKILLLSVLMLPSALHVKELRKRLPANNFKLIVGGAPFRFDDKLWKEVGADGYGKDSAEAIEIVTKMMEEMK